MAFFNRSSIPCPSCGSDETLQVTMSLSDAPVSFTLCSACEWKGWECQGELVPLDSVLDLVATPAR